MLPLPNRALVNTKVRTASLLMLQGSIKLWIAICQKTMDELKYGDSVYAQKG